MRPWSDFYNLAVPDLPGCPFAALDSALRESAIVFCERSLAWKTSHNPILVISGAAEYSFVPPDQAVVHTVTYARFEGEELEITGEANIRVADWRDQTGVPEYLFGGATTLTLVPKPDADGTLTLLVTLKPSPDATDVTDLLFDEFREAIVHGALARLMLSPKKPYSSLSLAQYHQQQFATKTAAAGTRVDRNYTRSPLKTAILRRG